jgi:hypothetical protein
MRPIHTILLMGGLAGLALFAPLCARADEKGDQILRAAFRTLHEAQSMTAELTTERTMTGQPAASGKGTVALKKPNLLSVTLMRREGAPARKQTYVSDGKNYVTYPYPYGDRSYMRQPALKKTTPPIWPGGGQFPSASAYPAPAERSALRRREAPAERRSAAAHSVSRQEIFSPSPK